MSVKNPNLIAPLMSSTAMTMTPIERSMGRFMRAPDHDAGGEGGGDASGSDQGADQGQGADAGSDSSTLLGGAADSGAGDAGADGDGKAADADGDQGADGGDKADEGAGAKDGDDTADADAKAKADAEAADAAIPETYTLEPIKVGEGDAAQTVEIDTKLLGDLSPLLKEAGVTQGALKKLAPAVLQVQEQVLTNLNNEHAAMRSDWEKQAREDKDIGGAKMAETIALAAKALDKFGAKSEIKEIDGEKVETNEFRRLLNDTGLGNHPVMLKMFREIGKLVGEDSELLGRETGPKGKVDRLEVLYPNDVPKN